MKRTTKMFKRMSMLLVAATMMLGTVGTNIHAEDESVIDDSKQGSLTLYKYNGDPVLTNDTYHTQKEMDDAVQDALTNGKLSPMEGVTFNYLNVGDVKQYTKKENTAENVTKVGYSLDTTTENWLGLGAGKEDYLDGTTRCYTPKQIGDALALKSQTEVEDFMKTNGSTAMPETDINGKSTKTGMALGLYLIVEMGYPSNATVTTNPFFVSVPMTDKTDAGYKWLYDVKAYPKNKTEEIIVDKTVVEADGNENKAVDAEIGQEKTFKIHADLPGKVGMMSTYKITDTLSSGLTYAPGNYQVNGIGKDGSKTPLTNGTDYTFTEPTTPEGATLVFDFKTEKLAEKDADKNMTAKYVAIEITYTAMLNKDAIIGGAGNPNDVKLEYSKKTNVQPGETDDVVETMPTELPHLFTYAIDLTKYGDDDKDNPLGNVTFKLLDKDGNEIKVLKDAGAPVNTYYIAADQTTAGDTITTDADGKVKILGLETGKYYLKETATNDGYNLLAKDIEIKITSNEGQYEAGTGTKATFLQIDTTKEYYTDANHTKKFVLPAGVTTGTWVSFGTNNVYDETGAAYAMSQPKALEWQANYSMNATNGEITLLVNNTSGFQLPHTGGQGTTLFLVIGGLCIAAAGAVLLMSKKKHAQE